MSKSDSDEIIGTMFINDDNNLQYSYWLQDSWVVARILSKIYFQIYGQGKLFSVNTT